MNLADITTKCYILALIIRDDGERLLLGDGAYEFKDSQQHFIANTYANDVVELQGTDGQMLAGQVRRTATQTFSGYIGDATFSKQKIEAARRDFLMFFRKKHYYTAVYVFSDGTAIQRDRGYIVNAPSVPELYQRYPEWSIGLNFEDPNYYEYAEDDLGQEIAAHKVELELSTAMSGGLIWDGDGAVSDDLSYVGTEIPGEGKNFQLADTGTATLKSAELLGDAEQNGTPTPDSPVPVNVVTGEQTVKIEGKNLFNLNEMTDNAEASGITVDNLTSNSIAIHSTSGAGGYASRSFTASLAKLGLTAGDTITISMDSSGSYSGNNGRACRIYYNSTSTTRLAKITSEVTNASFSIPNDATSLLFLFYVADGQTPTANSTANFDNIQLELGSTATAYEPYQGQTLPVNLGKNMFSISQSTIISNAYLDNNATLTFDDLNSVSITATGTQGAQYLYRIITGLDSTKNYTFSFKGTKNVKGSTGLSYIRITTYGSNDGSTWTNLGAIGNTNPTQGETYSFTKTLTGYTQYRFMVFNNADTPVQVGEKTTYSEMMLELGSQATTYAPYFTPIELAKIGAYQDRIYKDEGKWYVHKEIGKVVFDGTENWTLGYTGTPNFMYVLSNVGGDAEPSSGQISRLLKSNYGTDGNVGATNTDEGILIIVSTAQLRVRYGSELSIDAWKAKLASNNMILYYALATPTTTEITNSELVGQLERLQHAHTYADLTNFSITATSPNLPAFLKVVAFGDDAIPQGGYVWEDGGTGGATTITVDGVDNAQPIWTVVGLATNPSLTNITTGESIQWTGVVPNGQTLVVNMADMTASLSGANVFEFISGSWITLQAGNNRVSYSATAATGIATLEWNGVVG